MVQPPCFGDWATDAELKATFATIQSSHIKVPTTESNSSAALQNSLNQLAASSLTTQQAINQMASSQAERRNGDSKKKAIRQVFRRYSICRSCCYSLAIGVVTQKKEPVLIILMYSHVGNTHVNYYLVYSFALFFTWEKVLQATSSLLGAL